MRTPKTAIGMSFELKTERGEGRSQRHLGKESSKWGSGDILKALHPSLLMDQTYDVKETREIKDDSWTCGLSNYTTKMQLPLAQTSKTLGLRRDVQF